MEFYERLQILRRQKGLTQEELAQQLFVSRTAISKWESGRGYPSIDSLKAIAQFFCVTIDELLTGGESPEPAQEEQRNIRFLDPAFGLLDFSSAMLLVLPFFGQKSGGVAHAVSLLRLDGIAPELKFAYSIMVIALTLWGILGLALQNCRRTLWLKAKHTGSLAINALGVLLLIVSPQPYAAAYLFALLAAKLLLCALRKQE